LNQHAPPGDLNQHAPPGKVRLEPTGAAGQGQTIILTSTV
jgi:hypothetical protein